jgi:hypothetical protein
MTIIVIAVAAGCVLGAFPVLKTWFLLWLFRNG